MPEFTKPSVVAIVDPFSSGKHLAPLFKKEGVECVAIWHEEEISDFFVGGFKEENYIKVIKFNGDVDATVATLQSLNVGAVLAGSEPGVELSDLLSERLGVRTNGTEMAENRRNKFLMQEALKGHDIRSAGQCLATSIEEARDFCLKNGFPLVAKPLKSAGTDGVTLCHSLEEVEAVLEKVMGKVNRLGCVEDAVLLQEYLRGVEYVVDTVSLDGQHHVCHFWKYDKRTINNTPFLYYATDLLPAEGEVQSKLKDYIFKVLDILQIRNGPAHSEIMLLPNGEVCLVETGARVIGGNCAYIASQAIGFGQLELTVDVYLQGQRFREVLGQPYPLLKTVHMLGLIVPEEFAGNTFEADRLKPIESLTSFHSTALFMSGGQLLTRTIDLFSTPGIITLMHADEAQVYRDADVIRALERDSLYGVPRAIGAEAAAAESSVGEVAPLASPPPTFEELAASEECAVVA
eukprot:GILI01003879.1.p1 GENE.GILI01003879.1~~GILI01003879.1.p1  ORF type:complete len:462 (-),score=147.91 GILI01003879.1:378-1763(-)